jgi:asparagine synthase (glutamine-hydrolysing)
MNGKYIFKKALKQILPISVLQRRKMGFGVPLAQWFRNDLKDMAYEAIFECNHGCLTDRSTAMRIWKEHQQGCRNRSVELWALLIFQLWQRKFLRQATP